jgi:hypothetical protein
MQRGAGHEFCERTHFCVRCGCALMEAVEGRDCSPANVIAISHRLSQRWFDCTLPAGIYDHLKP